MFSNFFLEVSQIQYIRTIIIQIGKKQLGFRNLHEKLENNNSEICHTTPSTNEPSLFPNKQNFHFVPIKKGGGVQVLMTFKDCTMH